MHINQNVKLIQRKGKWLLTWLSGGNKPFYVSELDLVLLAQVLFTASEQQAAEALLRFNEVEQRIPSLTMQHVTERLQQLCSAAVLSRSALTETLHIDAKPLPEDFLPVSIPEALAVGMHLAVGFNQDHFYCWSAVAQCHYKLPLAAVMLLHGFAAGGAVEEVLAARRCYFADDKQLQLTLQQLWQAGLLVQPKLHAAMAEQEIPRFNTVTPTATRVLTDWQQLTADERIPVYFVPHMENHFPLALGVLYSALRHHDNGSLLNRFQLIPLNFLEPIELLEGPYRKFGAGVWLFSNYMWSVELNLQISQAVKQHDSKNLTIHGGPSTPDYQQACEDFMQQHRSVDIAAHGEGEVTITELFCNLMKDAQGAVSFDSFAMAGVAGITYRDQLSNKLIRTAPRSRMKEPDSVPSPYLSGYFDNYNGQVEAAIIETNRGCPYGCTFCDWGSATNQKIRVFDLERVKQEIDWIGRNNIRVMWIADANYGLYDRDIEISRHIVETKARYGYPQEVVVNYTKNSTWRLVEIIKVFSEGGIISQGIISIQTTDEQTLDVINRKNIRTERYDELAGIFADLNLPLSTDLMIGLPGITPDAFSRDLQRYIDMDVSVKAYPTQLLPNSPMADPAYIEKYQIKVDADNYLISTYSYTERELQQMKALYQLYTVADGYSLLRYVLRYLQWDHQIPAMAFLQQLLQDITATPEAYPRLSWAANAFNHDKSMPGGWEGFYRELTDYVVARYQVADDSAWQVVIQVNRFAMPDDSLQYPLQLTLQHDITAYFRSAADTRQPLAHYAPAQLTVSDPNGMVTVDLDQTQYDSHQYFWELHSAVARPKSVSEYAATA